MNLRLVDLIWRMAKSVFWGEDLIRQIAMFVKKFNHIKMDFNLIWRIFARFANTANICLRQIFSAKFSPLKRYIVVQVIYITQQKGTSKLIFAHNFIFVEIFDQYIPTENVSYLLKIEQKNFSNYF